MTKIKICGMRRPQDILAANAAGPDFVGFILSEGYRRSVKPEDAETLIGMLSPGIASVGVVVNEPLQKIEEIARAVDILQLHGDEDNEFIKKIRNATDKPIIQAFQIRSQDDCERALQSEADMLLLDNGTGTGEKFDWSLLNFIGTGKPWILAGGLEPGNIAEAIKRFHPYAVDLSSGAETNGWKDAVKMMQCVAEVRGTVCIQQQCRRSNREHMT